MSLDNKPSVNQNQSHPEEVTLYDEHPSMFRNRPLEFIFTGLLVLAGLGLTYFSIWLLALSAIGLFLYGSWWIRCKGTQLTITNERARLRKGILAKSVTEVWHRDVRNVQLDQSVLQRLFGVGSLGISSSGQSGLEISVSGIPDPERVKELIDHHRRG